MRRCTITHHILLLLLLPALAGAQILSDSLVQTVGYWGRGEQQTYQITLNKYRVSGNDTTGREQLQYLAGLTVRDSAADGYTLEWHIRNMTVTTRNPVAAKLLTLQEGLKILFRTNDVGVLSKLLNVDEVRAHMSAGLPVVRKQFKGTASLEKMIAPVAASIEDPEALETIVTRDLRQMLMFHGAQYQLGKDIRSAILIPGVFGGKALDGQVTLMLDQINREGNNYILRATETVDRSQLAERIFEVQSAGALQSGAAAPRREHMGEVSMEIETGSRIHGSGWVLYSFQTKTVSSGKSVSVEEVVMEIR